MRTCANPTAATRLWANEKPSKFLVENAPGNVAPRRLEEDVKLFFC